MTSIPVMVAAKDELFCTGLLSMLGGSKAVEAVGDAADTKTALKPTASSRMGDQFNCV